LSDYEHGTKGYESGCRCEICSYADHLGQQYLAQQKAQRIEKLLGAVTRTDGDRGCWEWARQRSPEGYAIVRWQGCSQLAHRVAYELLVGPIPDGLQIDHKCRNRGCVNPNHLQAVTSLANNENRSTGSTIASGARNVYRIRNRWQVRVRHEVRTYYGGSFVDLEDAKRAAVDLRNKLHTNNLADRRG
jgi:hypothetical protein